MAYAENRRWSPTGLGAAIAINAAVLAALATANPEVVTTLLDPPIDIYIPDDPPPPDPLPQPKPEQKTELARPVPDPPLDTSTSVIKLTEGPTIDPGPAAPPFDPSPPFAGPFAGPVEPPAPPPPLIGAMRDPRYEGSFQPDYPAAKLRLEEEGRITVRVLVGTDGRVKAIEPVGDADHTFFAATRRQALSRWRFKPATRGGAAEEQWITQRVSFTITS